MRQALEMALEALSKVGYVPDAVNPHPIFVAITAIKEALAQPEQEPVAYGTWDTMLGKGHRMMMVRLDKGQDGCTVPLYTTPPQRKPLTDEQIDSVMKSCINDWGLRQFARAIEAAHGIKE